MLKSRSKPNRVFRLFYFLAIHPEVQEQVAQEVLEVMDGKGSKDFDEEDIKNLK